MMDFIITDKNRLRACMIYEMLQKRPFDAEKPNQGCPIFQAYLHFCDTPDYPQLDYREFEFWYYRVQRGLTDFDYDISEELQNKPTLSDMPIDVVDRVLDNLKYKTHLVLREVCKSFREIVDRRAPPFNTITFYTCREYTWIECDECHKCYRDHKRETGCRGFRDEERIPLERRKVVINCENSVEMALGDLKRAIEHPSVRLDELRIAVCTGLRERVLCHLPRGTLHVRKLEINVKSQDDVMSILPYMTPGVLETLYINSVRMTESRVSMTEIIATDQWKQAKHLRIHKFTVQFPIESILHFETAHVRFTAISAQQLLMLRDALLLQPNFIYMFLQSSKAFDIGSIDEHLGPDLPQVARLPGYRYYPLPDCDDHVFEISLHPKFLRMRRTPKGNLMR